MNDTKGRARIQIRRPMGADVGVAEWSDWRLVGGLLQLVDGEGKPLVRAKGQTWSRRLREGESPDKAAQDLLHAKYRAGKSGSDFGRKIVYKNWGIV